MTITDPTRTEAEREERLRTGQEPASAPAPRPPAGEQEETDERQPIDYRALLAAAFSSSAAGLVAGGIFGSWGARLLGMFACLFGAGWAWLTLRSPRNASLLQWLMLPAAFVIGVILVVPAGGGGASNLPTLVSEAIESGRALRPPVPFDPGWRPIFVVAFSLLGYAAASMGAGMGKPRTAIALPLPFVAGMAITQPPDGELTAALSAFVPIIAALTVLFAGDMNRASELTKDFELKRALRAALTTLVAIAVLVGLSRTNFLFPEPVFDPDDQPQKPKARPLSEVEDVPLFEISTDANITGPWKTGVLDVFLENEWQLPPMPEERMREVDATGVVDPQLAPRSDVAVDFTVRGLKNSVVYPTVSPTGKVTKPANVAMVYDPRTGTLRVPEGRVQEGVTYTAYLPSYPDAETLRQAPAPPGMQEMLEIPAPPDSVQRLLNRAPDAPLWDRLDFVRSHLNEIVIAVGGGRPEAIPPSRVDEILEGDHEASPFEIVAVEAMLARWAGVPARVGFGFDSFNDEDGVFTIRPKNAAQWLEVYFEGHGWIPLISAPPQAKSSLENDPNAKFDPDVVASDEVAVELWIPIRIETLKQLYELLRLFLLQTLPWVATAAAAYLVWPAAQKGWRRRKRRRWADARGPAAQIAVEYAELRDLAWDLNVGDELDTPLEYLKKVADDDEHAEMAWLVARTMYGDMRHSATDADAHAAEELGASLRRRLFRGQPFQARVLAVLSRASLRQPYTDEVPNVPPLDPARRLAAVAAGPGRRIAHIVGAPFRLVTGRLPRLAFWGKR